MCGLQNMIRTLMLLWSLSLTTGQDSAVTCLFSKDCLLPCESQYHDIVHWHKINSFKEVYVHSYYDGKDQLQYQNEAYSKRTSLFSDQISTGNISLILRGVRIQDQGKYMCYTANTETNKETFVMLKVRAPIKSVNIRTTDDGITCNTNGVYPDPIISWDIDGQEEQKPLINKSTDSQDLFSLSTTLKALHRNTTYMCSVRLKDETQTYTASLKQEEIEISSGGNVTIHCPPRGDSGTFSLTLTFGDNTPILNYSSEELLSTSWKGAEVRVTQKEEITLHMLHKEHHAGTYTCERVTALSRQLVQTSVQINESQKITLGTSKALIIGLVVSLVVVALCAVFVFVFVCRRKKTKKDHSSKPVKYKGASSSSIDKEHS